MFLFLAESETSEWKRFSLSGKYVNWCAMFHKSLVLLLLFNVSHIFPITSFSSILLYSKFFLNFHCLIGNRYCAFLSHFFFKHTFISLYAWFVVNICVWILVWCFGEQISSHPHNNGLFHHFTSQLSTLLSFHCFNTKNSARLVQETHGTEKHFACLNLKVLFLTNKLINFCFI